MQLESGLDQVAKGFTTELIHICGYIASGRRRNARASVSPAIGSHAQGCGTPPASKSSLWRRVSQTEGAEVEFGAALCHPLGNGLADRGRMLEPMP